MNMDSLSQFETQVSNFKIPQTSIHHPGLLSKELQWTMLRLDVFDGALNGNKMFKLLPFLKQAVSNNKTKLLSFGGAHSNHIHALSYAGARFGFETIGVIRGYKEQALTPTLIDATQNGMHLYFAGSNEYKRRHDPDYVAKLANQYGQCLVIPEGGAGFCEAQGGGLMPEVIKKSLDPHVPDYLCISAGTGSTVRSLIASKLFDRSSILAFCALESSAVYELSDFHEKDCLVIDDFTMGGFARLNPHLARFMLDFEVKNGFLLDPVYTAKMCFGISDLINKGYFEDGSHIVSVHTGGLQGRRFALPRLKRMSEMFVA